MPEDNNQNMPLSQLWKTALGEVEVLVTKATYLSFFSTSRLISLERGIVTIGCNTPISINMLENRYYTLLKNLLEKHSGQNVSLVFKLAPTNINHSQSPGPLFDSPSASHSRTKSAILRPDFTFTTFAVSDSNQMAYAAATAVAANPGTSYNPLFFYGGVGVGKTHLMQAIGNEVLHKNPQQKVIYCMGEEFTNEIIDAIQTKTTKKFKDKYRGANILMLDDVQFLEGKLKVQEEFFHTFNALQRVGGQIILTSDRPPDEIDRLEERLQSRFEGGLLVDVQNPDFELRCAILRIKAKQKGVELPMSIAQTLAANTESVRRLEGFLTRLLSEANLKKIPISEDLARSVVGKPTQEVEPTAKKNVTPKDISLAIMRRFGLTLKDLKSERRNRPLARPRQVLMYLLRTELRLPLEEVGAWVGGRDHTTVIHAVDTITDLLSTNNRLREDVSWIKKELFG